MRTSGDVGDVRCGRAEEVWCHVVSWELKSGPCVPRHGWAASLLRHVHCG